MDSREPKTSTIRLVVAWIIVAIPLGWGVYQSIMKSLPLFRTSAVEAPRTGPQEDNSPQRHRGTEKI